LAAEITARTKQDPGESYGRITKVLGSPFCERIDVAMTRDQRRLRANLTADQLGITQLAGEPVRATFPTAPGDQAPIGGLKVAAENGWFAVRPSGTEEVYKIYDESFRSRARISDRFSNRLRIRSRPRGPRSRRLKPRHQGPAAKPRRSPRVRGRTIISLGVGIV
jgi:phosphoglucomutase